ncbi:MAG: AMP-binding protein [Streptosporangiales bacterium]|nr:AMP-binding protein [Streptosporangiales bacterium]
MSTADNLAVRLLRHAADGPDRVAIRQGDLAVSYAELERQVRRAAAVLGRLDVGYGQRVALLFPNDHSFVEALLAVIYRGAIAVPLNTRSGRSGLQYALADSGAGVLVAHHSLADRAASLAGDVGARVLLTDGDGWLLAGDGTHIDADPAEQAYPVRDDDVCLQPYTSGSTGAPKGCLLTHGGQYWNASAVREGWQLDGSDRGLVTAPLYHKNAMICVVKPLLLCGGTIVVGESPEPRSIPAEVERHACTYTTGVPATYELLLESGEHERRDLSSLRFVICGSAPLSEEFGSRAARSLGVPVIEAYGLTEGGPQVLMTPRDAKPRYGKAGKVMPGGEVRLLDVEDMPATAVADVPEVPLGEVGEMWVRNPGVTVGYFGLPEVTAKRISVDGWLRTGDLGARDADGYYQVLGRRDDMMNVGGENVYPTEVEKLLLTMPQVRQAVVVAMPHPRKGEVPAAFVKADGVTEDEVKAHCLDHGAAHAHPRRVWFVDEYPLGGTGKIDRAALTERAAELGQEGTAT